MSETPHASDDRRLFFICVICLIHCAWANGPCVTCVRCENNIFFFCRLTRQGVAITIQMMISFEIHHIYFHLLFSLCVPFERGACLPAISNKKKNNLYYILFAVRLSASTWSFAVDCVPYTATMTYSFIRSRSGCATFRLINSPQNMDQHIPKQFIKLLTSRRSIDANYYFLEYNVKPPIGTNEQYFRQTRTTE